MAELKAQIAFLKSGRASGCEPDIGLVNSEGCSTTVRGVVRDNKIRNNKMGEQEKEMQGKQCRCTGR